MFGTIGASCDTTVALANTTQDGSVIFAKNSDREFNEAQNILFVPGVKHYEKLNSSDDVMMVKTTYTAVPQAKETYSVILSKPFWIWGAEMGVNEHGVVIGNEAIFTNRRVPYIKANYNVLLGMDIVRLGLERSKTAREALDVMTQLHEFFDQGGNTHKFHQFYYHNAYLISDRTEAWILETAGRSWVAKRITQETGGVASISNYSQIERDWDFASSDYHHHSSKINFAQENNDKLITYCANGPQRKRRSFGFLSDRKGRVTVPDMFTLLRDHSTPADTNSNYTCPSYGVTPSGVSVCMHAGAGPIRSSGTTNSFVVHLKKDGSITVWTTATASPCTSIFKPLYFESFPAVESVLGVSAEIYDPQSMWWQHEVLHRLVLMDYFPNLQTYEDDRNLLENSFINKEKELTKSPSTASSRKEQLSKFSVECFEKSKEAELQWTQKLKKIIKSRPKTDQLKNGLVTIFLRMLFLYQLDDLNRRAKLTTSRTNSKKTSNAARTTGVDNTDEISFVVMDYRFAIAITLIALNMTFFALLFL